MDKAKQKTNAERKRELAQRVLSFFDEDRESLTAAALEDLANCDCCSGEVACRIIEGEDGNSFISVTATRAQIDQVRRLGENG